MSRNFLVVLERGSRWPTWLERPDEESAETWLVAQQADESCREFEARGFDLVAASDVVAEPDHAVLVCNGEHGYDDLAMRENLLRAMIGRVETSRNGQISLVVDGSSRTRQLGAEMALSLNQELEETSSLVRLRFRAQPQTIAPPAMSGSHSDLDSNVA